MQLSAWPPPLHCEYFPPTTHVLGSPQQTVVGATPPLQSGAEPTWTLHERLPSHFRRLLHFTAVAAEHSPVAALMFSPKRPAATVSL
jgi:hypothetical protein